MACARLAIDRCDAILTSAAVLLGCALCANTERRNETGVRRLNDPPAVFLIIKGFPSLFLFSSLAISLQAYQYILFKTIPVSHYHTTLKPDIRILFNKYRFTRLRVSGLFATGGSLKSTIFSLR